MEIYTNTIKTNSSTTPLARVMHTNMTRVGNIDPTDPLQLSEAELVAGRCLSAEHDAHASLRSMGQCMAMGQATGASAVLAVQKGAMPRAIPIATLRQSLLNLGEILS
jgi:hypothetical protein